MVVTVEVANGDGARVGDRDGDCGESFEGAAGLAEPDGEGGRGVLGRRGRLHEVGDAVGVEICGGDEGVGGSVEIGVRMEREGAGGEKGCEQDGGRAGQAETS